jgi:hypothetical protein
VAARSTAPPFEFHRDDSLLAKQWGLQGDKAPFKKNNYGVNIGGPVKVPGLWGDSWKSYFYFDYEGYRQTGGSNSPTLSIPSLAERNGDFRDWRDATGNLIPIYDPATIKVLADGSVVKQQFMGCDGHTPNVICPDRISAIVKPWLAALPNPTSGGPTNNYLAPAIPDTIPGELRLLHGPVRLQVGHDHFFTSIWHQRAPAKFVSTLPQSIANETVLGSAELVGEPVQLGPHVQRDGAEPHVDGVPEPQRRLRLGEPGLRE